MSCIVELQKAIDYIEKNIEEEINYETISKEIGMSPYYFHRMFSNIVGVSPAEYIRNRRLSLAADELSSSKQMYFSRIGFETERFCQLLGDSYFFSTQFGRYSWLMEDLVQLLLYSVLVVYISINDKYFREWGKALSRYPIGSL